MYLHKPHRQMSYEKIIKYLQGQVSEKEKSEILDWVEQSPENKREFILIKKAWALTSKSDEDFALSWKNYILPQIQEHKKRKLLFNVLQKAAILILVFALGGLTHYFIKSESAGQETVYADNFFIEVPLSQTSNIELPDGTLVMLNSGSTISYSKNFTYGKREVEITGEAYFDVKTDKQYPFIVKSPVLDIKVYGTRFNVEAYKEDESFSATLVEGSIGLLNKSGNELSLLKPGENASLDSKQSELRIRKVDTEMYTSWKEGKVAFRNENLEDL